MKTYERKNFPRTVKELKTMWEKGTLSFDNAVQRSFVYKNTPTDNRMSMLIDSAMRGFPIPPMYCNCLINDNSKIYDFLDGKQRTMTFIKFLNDEFILMGIPVFEMEDGSVFDLNGLMYSQLPEDFQDKIKTYSLTVYYYENMEQEDAEEMFRRLNNGKSLTAIELTRANAISKEQIKELGSHELFSAALTERSLAGYNNEDIVIKTWIELFNDNKSFETKNVRPIVREAIITDEQKKNVQACFDFAYKVYNYLRDTESHPRAIKKMISKTHLITLMVVFDQAVKKNISTRIVADWICKFFETGTRDTSISSKYNSYAKSGTAKGEAVKIRTDIVLESFGSYVIEYNNKMAIIEE